MCSHSPQSTIRSCCQSASNCLNVQPSHFFLPSPSLADLASPCSLNSIQAFPPTRTPAVAVWKNEYLDDLKLASLTAGKYWVEPLTLPVVTSTAVQSAVGLEGIIANQVITAVTSPSSSAACTGSTNDTVINAMLAKGGAGYRIAFCTNAVITVYCKSNFHSTEAPTPDPCLSPPLTIYDDVIQRPSFLQRHLKNCPL